MGLDEEPATDQEAEKTDDDRVDDVGRNPQTMDASGMPSAVVKGPPRADGDRRMLGAAYWLGAGVGVARRVRILQGAGTPARAAPPHGCAWGDVLVHRMPSK